MKWEFMIESLKILYMIALSQALLISVYLIFQKKGNSNSRRVLALLLVDFCVFLTGTFLLLSPRFHSIIYFAHLANLFVFLAAPLLYFYYQSLINTQFKFRYTMLKHALPFMILFSVMVYEIWIQSNHRFLFRPYGIVLLSVLFGQSILYLYFVFKQRGSLTVRKSDNQKAKWFGFLFLSVFFIFVFKLIIFILWNIFGMVDICIFFTGLFFILSFIIINMLVLYGLFNPDVLIHYIKYQNSPIDKKMNDSCFSDLQVLIIEKELFKDSLLSLNRLSKLLNVPEKLLSQIINENAGTNFNDFVNGYRIKEAQRIISSNDQNSQNILQIAYEVGFNSKSTFNTAFKKITGFTPSEYRKKNQPQ
jgi:AraC-like DNA-binding protein